VETLQLDLCGFADVQSRMSLIFIERPRVNVAFGYLERFPFNRKDMRKDLPETLSLLSGNRFVKGDDHPIHLAGGEIAAKITAQPKLGPCQICATVISLVHLVRDVEPAVVFHLAMIMVRRWVRVEIAADIAVMRR